MRLGQHSIVIATYGDPKWDMLAKMRALPSAKRQQHTQVVQQHYVGASLAEARNRAAECTTGDWLTFLDADDELAPGYIAAINAQIEELLYPEVMMFTPAVQYIYEDHSAEAVLLKSKHLDEGNYLVIGTTIHRDMFERAGLFIDWPAWEDWDLFRRISALGAGVVPVPDAVYRAWVTDGRNSSAENNQQLLDEMNAAHYDWKAVRGI